MPAGLTALERPGSAHLTAPRRRGGAARRAAEPKRKLLAALPRGGAASIARRARVASPLARRGFARVRLGGTMRAPEEQANVHMHCPRSTGAAWTRRSAYVRRGSGSTVSLARRARLSSDTAAGTRSTCSAAITARIDSGARSTARSIACSSRRIRSATVVEQRRFESRPLEMDRLEPIAMPHRPGLDAVGWSSAMSQQKLHQPISLLAADPSLPILAREPSRAAPRASRLVPKPRSDLRRDSSEQASARRADRSSPGRPLSPVSASVR